ncbi:unnamed protein product [Staurois parvus]|uniref:Fibronectin type-III domain-containing protein n=1 Tax=Staurois parvus TaxID=386267 RepID=A0ABN9B1W2_9NEOB|nr:unnamed protein product [Staurois parvus]
MVYSYNLNTTLHWNYSRMELKPYFCVERLEELEWKWKVIETCQNISHRYCGLHEINLDPVVYYKFRVKALVGSNISSAATMEFSLSSVGTIGPPELKVHTEEKIIVIDIFHPEVPSVYEIELGELNYIVYYGNDTKKATDCDMSACKVTFSISDQKTYCFSAQGTSDYFLGMIMEKSKEICIQEEKEISIQTTAIIIGVTVGLLAILAIFLFIIVRWTKARSLMPQSLSSVVSNIVAYAQMQKTSRYDNVSTSPIEPTVEEIPYMEEKVKIDTDVSTDSVSKESTDPGYQSSLTENEEKTYERGDEQSNNSSYFHTDSGTSGNDFRDTPLSEKDQKISEHAPEPPRPLTNSFGYDKPHFPKELV